MSEQKFPSIQDRGQTGRVTMPTPLDFVAAAGLGRASRTPHRAVGGSG